MYSGPIGPRVPTEEERKAIVELASWIDEAPEEVAQSLGFNEPPLRVAPDPMPVNIQTGTKKMVSRPIPPGPIKLPEPSAGTTMIK